MPPKKPQNLDLHLDLGDRTVQVVDGLGRIDMDNLREETEEAGAQCLWFGTLHARAKKRADAAKLARDVQAATIAKQVRAVAIGRAERPTDKTVADAVLLHPDYQRAAHVYLDAQEQADVLENVKFTLARKQDTCRALAAITADEHFARQGPRDGGPRRMPMGRR